MSGAEDQESSRSPVALNKLNDPKWQLPGWRIEQRYSTGVLIGNWSEDRLGKVRPPGISYPDRRPARRGLERIWY